MWTWALLRIAVVNTWPVCMSAKYTLQHALQGGAAVSRGVDLEEPGFGFDLVAGGAQHDRVPQQTAGPGGRLSTDRITLFHGCQVPVHRGC